MDFIINSPVRQWLYRRRHPKHFWAFAVWNYADNAIQILEVTQATILGQFSDLIGNTDWGDPRGYDITVIRKGQSLDTEYTVQPSPHKALHPDIEKAFGERKLKLEALFEGGDPFAGDATVAERRDDDEFAGKIEPPEVVRCQTPPPAYRPERAAALGRYWAAPDRERELGCHLSRLSAGGAHHGGSK